MADNVPISAGSGTDIATDDVAGKHYQRVKLTDGTADSTAVIPGSAANGLDVDVTRFKHTQSSPVTATWDNSTPVDTALVLDVTGYASVGLGLSIAGAGDGILRFEGSLDGGTTWYQVNGWLIDNVPAEEVVDLAGYPSGPTALIVESVVGPLTRFQVRLTNAITSTRSVDLRLLASTAPSRVAMNPGPIPIHGQGWLSGASDAVLVLGPDQDGDVPVYQQPVMVAGWDASFAVRTLKTDAAGELQVDVLSSALPTGASTETTLGTRLSESDYDTKTGSLTETVPASDTASSGLNGRLQRLAQRITSLIALLPTALVGGRLDTNNGAWLGSTAPTVAQKTMAASIPVVVASDQSAIPVSGPVTDTQIRATPLPVSGTVTASNTTGDVAHDAADSGNPVKIGARAAPDMAAATMAAAADRTDLLADIDGALIVKEMCPFNNILSERTTNTDGTSTALSTFGATASARNMITAITVYNESATDGFVDIRDGTAGAVLWTIPLPTKGGAHLTFNPPLRQPTANTALAYDVNAALTTVYLSFNGFKSKA